MAEIFNVKEDFCDIDEGCYLILVNPESIPHLVYLQDGRYYSLTYKGTELGFSFPPFLERLVRLQKKTIFLEVKRPKESPFQVFSEYVSAGNQEQTCFYPIKQLLLKDSSTSMIFELIPELYMNGIIKSATHFNLQDLLDDKGDFKMAEYTKEDVLNHISELKSKYAER